MMDGINVYPVNKDLNSDIDNIPFVSSDMCFHF